MMLKPAKLNMGLYFMAIIALLIFMLLSGNSTIDMHLHDTYLVFPKSYLFKAPAIFVIAITLLYILTRRFTRITSLTFIHTLGTLGLIAWILKEVYYPAQALQTANFNDVEIFTHRMRLIYVVIKLLLWWQLLLPLNWWLSTTRKPES